MTAARHLLARWEAGNAPVAALLGIVPHSIAPGCAALAMHPAQSHYNPLGTVHGGVIATLLASAMTEAVGSALPAGRGGTIVEMKVSYARALTVAAGQVVGTASVVHAGRQVALAEARLTDAAGQLYATASATLLVGEAAQASSAAGQRDVTWPDPACSPPAISRSGLELLRDPAMTPPFMHLLGMAVVQVDAGLVRMALPAGAHVFGRAGTVHEGMVATLLDSVMACAIHTTLPPGQLYTTLEIKLSLLRAVTGAGGVLTGTGHMQHAGPRIATAQGTVVDAAGQVCATATTTCLVFAARPSP